MTRLINMYRIFQRAADRIRLQAYLDEYPLAIGYASQEEIAFLKAHGFSI